MQHLPSIYKGNKPYEVKLLAAYKFPLIFDSYIWEK